MKAGVSRFVSFSFLHLTFYLHETTCLRGEMNSFNQDQAAAERETGILNEQATFSFAASLIG